MLDDMFFLPEHRALRRGRRIASRTPTCRPCLVWLAESPEQSYNGIALDVSPYGMRVRMMTPLPEGRMIFIQMMRDEDFAEPLMDPIQAKVVRSEPEADGFLDHGFQILREKLESAKPRRAPALRKEPAQARPTRMYTLDVLVGDAGHAGRERG